MRELFARPPVPAAVLVPIVDRADGLAVLLTQRSSRLPHHPGQISFPGGRLESTDADAVAAALRETEEEIGLPRSLVRVAGFLPDHLIPVSGYRVTPVVSFVDPRYELRLDPTEVDEAFEVPLGHFLDPTNHVARVREYAGEPIEFIDMPFGPRNIWGATAGMLLTLYRLLRGEELAA
jgi:8-oxo-dGTP pyrophosphatase MutT (NUDIX family)